jgi:hypothetical protein
VKNAKWINPIAPWEAKNVISQNAPWEAKNAKWINPNAIKQAETNALAKVVPVPQAENVNAQIVRIAKMNAATNLSAKKIHQAE